MLASSSPSITLPLLFQSALQSSPFQHNESITSSNEVLAARISVTVFSYVIHGLSKLSQFGLWYLEYVVHFQQIMSCTLIVVWSLLVQGAQRILSKNHHVVINETNLSTGCPIETKEFIELKFTDFCLFKRGRNNSTKKGPSHDGYYLFQIVRVAVLLVPVLNISTLSL